MTQIQDTLEAFRIATTPSAYSNSKVAELFNRGYSQWESDDSSSTDQLMHTVDQFGEAALKSQSGANISVSLPLLQTPSALVAAGTVAGIISLNVDPFDEKDVPQRNNGPYRMIRGLVTDNMVALIQEGSDEVVQELAEIVFEKGPGEEGLHPGRVCTGIRRHTGIGPADAYLKIPLVAATKQCYKKEEEDDGIEIQARLQDNMLYTPIDRFYNEFRSQWEDAFDTLVGFQESHLTDDQLNSVLDATESIQDMVSRWEKNGHHDRLYHNYDPADAKLRFLIRAVREADEDIADVASPLKAEAIKQAVDTYDLNETDQQYANEFQSGQAIAQFLQDQEHKFSVEISRGENFDLYELRETTASGFTQLSVDHMEDLLELPCFEEMFKDFEESGPVHHELYNFAATAKWLDRYYNASKETFIEDMKEMFSQYSWYDPEITAYQAGYEKKRPHNPMRCDHTQMENRCIGPNRCDYRIYASLPFTQDLYNKLDDKQSRAGIG
jgi:hypothetical protein